MSSVVKKIMNVIGAFLVFGLLASIGVPYYAVSLNSGPPVIEDRRPIFTDSQAKTDSTEKSEKTSHKEEMDRLFK